MDIGPSNILFQILLIFVLVLLNAFFASSEMAIVSLNKSRLSVLSEEGDEKAKLLLKLLDEPTKFLSTIQIGITLAGFLASASAATSLSVPVANVLKNLGIPASDQISLILVTLLLAYFTLVFGELFPKRLALQNAEKTAMSSVRTIIFISIITSPFIKILTASTNILVRLSGNDPDTSGEQVSEAEIRMMIGVGEENGIINETEREMLDSIFEFDNTLAKQIMTPRVNVFALDIETPIEELIDRTLEEQYSRIPIYENEIDNIIGILYMKDLFRELRKGNIDQGTVRRLIRIPYFVPETKNIDVLFKELQATKNHLTILIDEYGSFSGIVSIEDLIEEVMGNIFDEYDENFDEIKKIDSDTYIVDGFVSIDDINDATGLNIQSNDFDTIGGFVVSLLGHIPIENEEKTIEYENIVFTVEKVDEKRISKLKILIK
jgi:putative hemolysin